MWKVCGPKGKWLGVIETNYAWAIKYWTPRGFILQPFNG